MDFPTRYDVIVIGGGHAGTEAALASARVGARTLLLTHNIETLGQMSCNPSIGGIGKGHLVKEVDALGGAMALATDEAGIQFRILNASKGPAVRATRAQADRVLYKAAIRHRLENQPNLDLFQQAAADLIMDGDRVAGVVTEVGIRFQARAVVLTAGTFLNGRVHVGLQNHSAGRAGDPPAIRLAEKLKELGLPQGRLKTGTPPRIDGRSIDYSVMQAQPGDDPVPVFSFIGDRAMHPRQLPCWITHTTTRTHDIIRGGLDRSPMYTGVIEGVGPRYCPSIEDKVVRFADRDTHGVFLEPESLRDDWIYCNGISTSLPHDVQDVIVRSMPGCERANILRYGYAVEYDMVRPHQLEVTGQTRGVRGLYLAGQINGTSGYEEAAAQGLVAGANAALAVVEREPWVVARSEAYIGVLMDDLVTKTPVEPYRMFTSRAEHRLLLRADNAAGRLTPVARRLGLLDGHELGRARERVFARRQSEAASLGKAIDATPALAKRIRAQDFELDQLRAALPGVIADARAWLSTYAERRYEAYVVREVAAIKRHAAMEGKRLPEAIDYRVFTQMRNEARESLARFRPRTFGQAGRLEGITPADLTLLMVLVDRWNKSGGESAITGA